MIARNLGHGFAACCLLALGAAAARAVDYLPEAVYDSDAQFFAPADIDFDGLPIGKESGYFFNFEKLSWAATGERTRLGTENPTDASMNPFRVFQSGGQLVLVDPTDPDGDVILLPGVPVVLAPPQLLGNLGSVNPRSDFAWGERYEFGHSNEECGWAVSILDGPNVQSGQFYGFGITGQDDTVGGAVPSRFPLAPGQLISPLGSVIIVFDDPQNLMLGYLDVVDGLVVGTVPGDALENDSNGDGVLDGDGFADDINRNGQFGPDGIDTEDPGEVPDRLGGGLPHDFGDLVELPTSWQFVDVRNSTEMNGFELTRVHHLSNEYMMAKHQNNSIDIMYGVRYLRMRDKFNVNAEGGVLGASFWHTKVDNNLVGPHIGANWRHQRQRLGFDFNGRFMFAYNISNFEQTAALGEDLIMGQHNHPLWFPASYNTHGKQENDFSPTVELRAQASYQLTSSLALKLGYTALFIDNISRAAQQVRYELPRMGFEEGEVGEQNIFVNGVDFGFEAVY